jgi:pimeloyl-ACP methyl ester carboxylesterase
LSRSALPAKAAEAPPEAWFEWGGNGVRLVFGHANGFPPGTYRVLLEELSATFNVASFAARPLWPGGVPDAIGSWHELAGDIGSELARRERGGVVGVGHSLGGVLNLIAAAADGGRYTALVLVEPVVFSGFHALFWGALKGLGLGPRLPLIRGARRRRDAFADIEEVRTSYSKKPVFASWDPRVLDDYIRVGFEEVEGGGVMLRYSKAWESRIFEITPANVWPELERIEVPMLFIRGADSDTFLANAAARVRRRVPTARVIEIPAASHFVPMERPIEVARLITNWAREIGF